MSALCVFTRRLLIHTFEPELSALKVEFLVGFGGAQTNAGRKGRPAIPVKAGEQVTLAEVHGSSGTVRRIEATISDRSPAMLRGLKIEMFGTVLENRQSARHLVISSARGLGICRRSNLPCLPVRRAGASTAISPCRSEPI